MTIKIISQKQVNLKTQVKNDQFLINDNFLGVISWLSN